MKHLSSAIQYLIQNRLINNLNVLDLSNMNIEKIDRIDSKIASEIMELNISYNKLNSLNGLEQFTSLVKLDVSFNNI